MENDSNEDSILKEKLLITDELSYYIAIDNITRQLYNNIRFQKFLRIPSNVAYRKLFNEESISKPSCNEMMIEQHSQKRIQLKRMLTVLPDEYRPNETIISSIESILCWELSTIGSPIVEATKLPRLKKCNKDGHPIFSLWRGDITLLKIEAIVNAANCHMVGCFTPDHACIDNAIHCKAGPRLRAECQTIMDKQGHLEETGKVNSTPLAKLTKAYCLPCEYVLHTVGPIAKFKGHEQPEHLASCYKSCLSVAAENSIRQIAFCCISTGVFGYPQEAACHVALAAVKSWLQDNSGAMDLVVFNTFTMEDTELYEKYAEVEL